MKSILPPTTEEIVVGGFFSTLMDDKYSIVVVVIFAIVVPLFLSSLFMSKKKVKQRGDHITVGGEPSFAMRNVRSREIIEVPWEGTTIMVALFEQSCKKHSHDRFLGTRIVERGFVTGSDGRIFEKLHFGEYQWETYG